MSGQEHSERSTMYVADVPFAADSEIQDVKKIPEALENAGYDVTMSRGNSHFIITRERKKSRGSEQ